MKKEMEEQMRRGRIRRKRCHQRTSDVLVVGSFLGLFTLERQQHFHHSCGDGFRNVVDLCIILETLNGISDMAA